MGTVVSVDSVVYNLAGDEAHRPNYMKTLIDHNILSGTRDSIGDSLRDGYLHGPAMQLRSFFNWASRPENYSLVGLPTGKLESNGSVSSPAIAGYIPHDPTLTVAIQSSSVDYARASVWADQWMLANYPADFDSDWAYDYNSGPNRITIHFADGSSTNFTPSDFNYSSHHLYVYYDLTDSAGTLAETAVFIYRIGSGNPDLDALINASTDYGEFFPFIPFRLDNHFLSESYMPTVYAQIKKAYKKATGKKLKKLIDKVSDNANLSDIDHAYVVFGVSLNVVENACKRYIYAFFETLQLAQNGGAGAYAAWKASVAAWVSAGGTSGPGAYPGARSNTIQIAGIGTVNSRYDVRISWNYVADGSGLGEGRAGAKKGDLWFQVADAETTGVSTWTRSTHSGTITETSTTTVSKIRLYWQRTSDDFTYLDLMGLRYENNIYQGHTVTYDARDAILDTDESGFIIPLHYDTWRSTSLVETSQMATACVFTVFNCYTVKKTKWYESGIFRILLVIVIAIASAVFTGGAGFGLLGANLAIGTSLGLSGITAAIVGSIVNALAAMVVSMVLEKVAQGFGIIGQILSAVLMMVIGQVSATFQTGASFDWTSLFRVDNLLKLTDAVGRGLTSMIQNDTLGLQQQWADFAKNAKLQSDKIQQEFFKEFGYGAGIIDPNMFVDSSSSHLAESSDTFLTRTLMTGSEIAEMSRELISGYVDYSLKLPDAFT
jgi:hypothetical protein